MLKENNQWTSRSIMEPEIVIFVSKTALSVDENLGEFKGQKNSSYGEFEI